MNKIDSMWQTIIKEADAITLEEPVLASFYHASLLNHGSLRSALSYQLASLLGGDELPAILLRELFDQALDQDESIESAMRADLQACLDRDPACEKYMLPFLHFKGFQSLQAYRIGHWLWGQGRKPLALFLQSRVAHVFDVDIHPAARLGKGLFMDHATGVVIGETAVVGDNVSMLHAVTLGGSGCAEGDRHPKVGCGVLISAGAKILGNITVGDGAKIGAGSLVLEAVPAHTTVVGVPARIVGRPASEQPALNMNHQV